MTDFALSKSMTTASVPRAETAEFSDFDARLMERVGLGDREALGLLVERHRDALVNYLTKLGGNRSDAEELAQEAFLRVFQAALRGRYREQGRFLGFLYRVATNLHRSEGRHARRFLPFAAPRSSERTDDGRRLAEPRRGEGQQAAVDHQESQLLMRERHRRLTRALADLPWRYRVPIVLFAIEGWSHRTIAEMLGCREGTVKSRIHRGRERLRRTLEPLGLGAPL